MDGGHAGWYLHYQTAQIAPHLTVSSLAYGKTLPLPIIFTVESLGWDVLNCNYKKDESNQMPWLVYCSNVPQKTIVYFTAVAALFDFISPFFTSSHRANICLK